MKIVRHEGIIICLIKDGESDPIYDYIISQRPVVDDLHDTYIDNELKWHVVPITNNEEEH